MDTVIILKRLFRYFSTIREESFCLLAGSLKTSCAMVFCAYMILVHIGPDATPHTFGLYRLALELTFSPVGVLLVGGLCAVIVEDLLGH